MSNPSNAYRLIEKTIGQPLDEYVRTLRQDGNSWQAVSFHLANRTDVVVTPETIRIWLGHLPGMERGKAGAA